MVKNKLPWLKAHERVTPIREILKNVYNIKLPR